MGAHDEQDSAGEEEGTGDASGGEGANADTSTLTPHSIHLADTGFGTRLSALLTPPFNQLTSPSLHAAAHAHHLQHAAQPDKPTTPPAADDTPMSPATRTTPTLVGERCSTSGTASQPVSTGVGSGKSLLVQSAKSYAHAVGFKQVQQAGAVGSKQVTHSVKVKGDGTEVAKNKVAEQITNQPVAQIEIVGARLPNALTKAKSAQQFTDSRGISHRETYYDLPMNVVINACGGGGYTVRAYGAKVDKDGYILVAANYGNYPRCSVVETSMGPGKVYDTGGFAVRHPHGFDLATDWTNGDGR